ELLGTEVTVLIEESVENRLRLWPVLREEVLLVTPNHFGSLFTGAKRCVEGEMAEEIERIGVRLPAGLGESLKVDATLGEGEEHLFALERISPAVLEIVC